MSTSMSRLPMQAACAMLAFVLASPALAQKTLPLASGQTMERNVRYTSATGGHYLIFQPDGNLAVYTAANGFVWGLNTVSPQFSRAARVVMQADGNLTVFDAKNQWVWSALTANPTPGSVAQIAPSGALQLVSRDGAVRWASDGKLAAAPRTAAAAPPPAAAPANSPPAAGSCAPLPKWPKCVTIGSPDLRVYGSPTTSASALTNVAKIYREMTSRLRPKYPASKFDGFRAYVTNRETQAQLAALPEIAEFAPDPSGPNSKIQLQGGANARMLWISEQMICKTGVVSRGPSDKEKREFDQVVHEFGHSIDGTFGLRQRINAMYTAQETAGFPAAERFPWTIQRYFSTPAGSNSPKEQALLNDLFTGPTSFSCADYRP